MNTINFLKTTVPINISNTETLERDGSGGGSCGISFSQDINSSSYFVLRL